MKLKELLGLMLPSDVVCIRVMKRKKRLRDGKVVTNHDHEVIRGLVSEAYNEKMVDKDYLDREIEKVYSYWDEQTFDDGELIQRWSGIEIWISGMEIEG